MEGTTGTTCQTKLEAHGQNNIAEWLCDVWCVVCDSV
jgi:hypothetical protein